MRLVAAAVETLAGLAAGRGALHLVRQIVGKTQVVVVHLGGGGWRRRGLMHGRQPAAAVVRTRGGGGALPDLVLGLLQPPLDQDEGGVGERDDGQPLGHHLRDNVNMIQWEKIIQSRDICWTNQERPCTSSAGIISEGPATTSAGLWPAGRPAGDVRGVPAGRRGHPRGL